MNRRTILTAITAALLFPFSKLLGQEIREFYKDDLPDAQLADNGEWLNFKHPKIPKGYVVKEQHIKINNNTREANVTRVLQEINLIRPLRLHIELQQSYAVRKGKVINFESVKVLVMHHQ